MADRITIGLDFETQQADLKKFFSHIDDVLKVNYGYQELSQMGMVNSAVYRQQVLDLFTKKGKMNLLSEVLLAFTFFKRKERALRILRKLEYKDAAELVRDSVVSAQERGRRDSIADVNVTSGFPEVSALYIAATLAKDVSNGKYKIEQAVEKFIANQCVGQLDLAPATQQKHKEWEKKFWLEEVKPKGGKPAVFNESFYDNKINDHFPLIKKDSTPFKKGFPIDEKVIKEYITHFRE
jgi:hypothetical protein